MAVEMVLLSQGLGCWTAGFEGSLKPLMGLGFDEDVAQQALQRAGGDVSAAADYLLSLDRSK